MPIPRKPEEKEYREFACGINHMFFGPDSKIDPAKLPLRVTVNHKGQQMFNEYLSHVDKEAELLLRAIPVGVVIDQSSPFVAHGKDHVEYI